MKIFVAMMGGAPLPMFSLVKVSDESILDNHSVCKAISNFVVNKKYPSIVLFMVYRLDGTVRFEGVDNVRDYLYHVHEIDPLFFGDDRCDWRDFII